MEATMDARMIMDDAGEELRSLAREAACLDPDEVREALRRIAARLMEAAAGHEAPSQMERFARAIARGHAPMAAARLVRRAA